ncbi:DUF4974 domain-containing protein [Fulvivirga sp. M361]|uniref:FecR family protein n=1 Tax=Fulvivirga sp. M361 TaxID=2594266 RepID=UPI00117B7A4A|nr:FecR domain-containing protein [Fulvivirga sp. M361]TRX58241.1 DUF4974 domain-containing protein [Fulvivirga sp. M361]
MKTPEELISDSSFQNWVHKTHRGDQEFWERWVQDHPEQKDQVEIAIAMIRGINFKKDAGLSKEEVSARFAELNTSIENRATKHITSISWKTLYRAAAIFIGVAAIGLALWNSAIFSNQKEHRTDFGEIASVTLPDGSEVLLNGNSTLIHSKSWSENEPREVWLKGEAFFNVNKQLKKDKDGNPVSFVKFIVHASDLNVQVIGTEFNVRDRRGETYVVLNSGEVELIKAITTDTSVISMVPGEMVKTIKGFASFEKKKVDPEKYISWTGNKLIFDATPLDEIILILEDTYGFKTHLKDASLTDKKLTGELSVESADDLINALSIALSIKITRKDKELVMDNY